MFSCCRTVVLLGVAAISAPVATVVAQGTEVPASKPAAAKAVDSQKALASAKLAYVEILCGKDAKSRQPALAGFGGWTPFVGFLASLDGKVKAMRTQARGTAKPDKEAAQAASTLLATALLSGKAEDAERFAASAASKAVIARFARRLTQTRKRQLIGAVIARIRGGARFKGQFAALRTSGSDASSLLLGVVEDPPQGVTDPLRADMVRAIGDVATTLSEDQTERLSELATDDFEDEAVRANAAIVLSQFGKPDQLERLIASKVAATKKDGGKFAAWRSLASVYWQAEQYAKAVAAYDKAIQAGEGKPAGVMATVHYNKACSLALADKIDAAFEALDVALKVAGNDARNLPSMLLASDRDLANLRKDRKRFAALLGKHGRSIQPQKAAAGTAPKSRPAARSKDSESDGDDGDDDDDEEHEDEEHERGTKHKK